MKYILIVAFLLAAACSDSGDDSKTVVAQSERHHEDVTTPTADPTPSGRTQFPIDQQQEPTAPVEQEPEEPTYTDVTVYTVVFMLAGHKTVAECDHIMDGNDEPQQCGLNLWRCKDNNQYYCITGAQVTEKTEHRLDKKD